MILKRIFLCFCLSVVPLSSAIADNYPVEKAVAYFSKADSFLDAEIAADAAHYSLLRMAATQPRIEVFTIGSAQKKLKYSADLGPSLFNWHAWVDNKRILTSITLIDSDAPALGAPSKKKKRKKALPTGLKREFHIHNIEDGSSRLLLSFELNMQMANGSDQLLHRLPEEPDHVLIAYAPDAGHYPGVYKLNLLDGSTTEIEASQKPFINWEADHDGNLRLASGWGEEQLEVKVKPTADADWQSLNGHKLFEDGRFGIIGFSDDGNNLYVRSSLGKGRSTIYRFDMKRKAIRQKIFEHEVYDAGTLIMTDGGKTLVAATYVDDKLQYKFFDEAFETYRKTIAGKIDSGLDFHAVSFSKDGDKSLIVTTSPTSPSALYLYNREAEVLELLVSPDIPKELTFAEMKSVSFFSRDGIEIPAFLTLPIDHDPASPGPAIIMPHGGPWVRDMLGYDPWVQFLASQGYTVLQPNYRGSTGYGDAFEYRGYGEWGKAMQKDLDDGADWLVSKGYAAKDRMCMVGGSYGGYAALAAATIKGFPYKCAVAFAPVSDLLMWVNAASTSKGEKQAMMFRTAGSKKTKALKKVSPVFLAKNTTMPLLIAHGTADIRVSPEHSRRMVYALQKAKKQHEVLWFEGGSHFLLQTEHKKRYFSELAKFLQKHTGKNN